MIYKYKSLYSPLRIKNLILKNRIITAPMGVPKATVISSTNYGGISLFDKSMGGAAVVTVNEMEIASISHEAYAFNKYAKDVAREVLSVSRQSGGMAQIEVCFHAKKNDDGTIQSPSNGKHFTGGVSRAMTHEEMKAKIDEVCKVCIDAKNFGFDMILLHFGHDSLCSSFLSPVWNQRTDEYGGSLENRIRFPKEALKAIREAVGNDYPIMMRISRELKVPESYTEDDMIYFIKNVEKYIDIVNVSCGMDCYGGTIENYVANNYMAPTNFLSRMYNLNFCERVKKECNTFVCIVGGVSDPEVCDKAIYEGKTDLVMMGRQLVADPYLPKKAQNGQEDDIVPCIRCMNCYHIATGHDNVQCSVNPRFRRENRVPLVLERTNNPKKVVIVGGGPAGMKAAITASEKGHKTILLEKSNTLGGQLIYADYDEYKADLKKYREYLKHQINKSDVEVRLHIDATPDYVKSLNPDAIIVAVGADFITPNIKGVEYAKQAVTVYPKINDIKGEIVVVGGGTIGSEIGLELSDRKNKVTIIEKNDVLASNCNWLYRHGLKQQMDQCDDLTIMLETSVKEIRKDGVLVVYKDGSEKFVKADHILLAVGMKSRKDLAFSFYGITPETAMVGDCFKVAKVLEATNDSYFIAANI